MVLEDGAPREVRSFRLIERSAPSAIAQSAPGSDQPDALRYPTLITFVFDHLTQNGRALARRAAIQFVSRELAANQWVAVYGLEQRLRLAQPFSRDAPELRSAIERATMVSAESHDRLTVERTDPEASERAASSAIAAAGSGGNAALGAAISEVVVRDVLAHMEHLVEASESQQRGQSTLFPLMALMKAQGSLAGRKALVFFSEGLSIPPNLEEAYRSAISEANRANVSIYAVDARGLDTGRALDQSRQMLDRSGRTSQAQLLFGGSQKPVTLDDIMSSERAEGALRTDTQNALRALAEETSGALIANTNDLGPGLIDRVRGDLDSYYEIGYMPGSGAADGRFRSVEVKLARKGVNVHSRSGYFALPETDTTPLLPFELPMLSAAAAMPPPQAFEDSAAAFRFDRSPKGIQHTVVVEVPLDHLMFEENRRARTYALRFTAMTLVKDQNGQIVQRSSETYPLEGPLDRLPALKRGRLRFKRQLWLPPGHYTLWTIARDQATERSSVKSVPLTWPSLPVAFASAISPSFEQSIQRAERTTWSRTHFGREVCGWCRTSICRSRRLQTPRFPHISRSIHRPAPEIPRSHSNSCATAQSLAAPQRSSRNRMRAAASSSSRRFQRRSLRRNVRAAGSCHPGRHRRELANPLRADPMTLRPASTIASLVIACACPERSLTPLSRSRSRRPHSVRKQSSSPSTSSSPTNAAILLPTCARKTLL